MQNCKMERIFFLRERRTGDEGTESERSMFDVRTALFGKCVSEHIVSYANVTGDMHDRDPMDESF